MERLTFDGDFCDISMCREELGGPFCEEGYCSQRRVWERLKFIEDILGGDYNLDRLQELAEADREGRCDEDELTPCPFCGGEASVGKWSASRTVDIWCSNPECDALQSGTAKSYEAAFEAAKAKWNRRAGEEDQDG